MATIESKIKGWRWVVSELDNLLTRARAEADRLLGPDRGE